MKMLKLFLFFLVTYLLLCGLLYFFQESLIFLPQKLDKGHRFRFDAPFEEINTTMPDGISLHGLLFPADSSKGLIFYLHGNAGSVDDWGEVASTYTAMRYDVYIPDYRGYGKSEGKIASEQQLHDDVRALYKSMLRRYAEGQIIVLGYSIGTGPAAKLAAETKPRMLILQAPYYSLADLVAGKFKVVPSFLLKFPLLTHEYAKRCTMPIVMFHGDEDEVIPFDSAERLLKEMKKSDVLIPLKGQAHNGVTENVVYQQELKKLLE